MKAETTQELKSSGWRTPDETVSDVTSEDLFKAIQALVLAGHVAKALTIAVQHGWAARSWRSRAGLGVRLYKNPDGTVLIDQDGITNLTCRTTA